jgi:hypothetical protein
VCEEDRTMEKGEKDGEKKERGDRDERKVMN